jgi:H+/Na+-translocating ferredoxin:NAD+ oxidoreductase subunit B
MLSVRIIEENCVGCTKCLAVCPVDAIVGMAGMLHRVLADECIGCRLCIEPCPMDCIELLEPTLPLHPLERHQRATKARTRVQRRMNRLNKEKQLQLLPPVTAETKTQIQSDIQAAIQRVNAKKG